MTLIFSLNLYFISNLKFSASTAPLFIILSILFIKIQFALMFKVFYLRDKKNGSAVKGGDRITFILFGTPGVYGSMRPHFLFYKFFFASF